MVSWFTLHVIIAGFILFIFVSAVINNEKCKACGWGITELGAIMNVIVMAANHGRMPVIATSGPMYEQLARDDGVHCLLPQYTRFPILADIHQPLWSIVSIGDMAVIAGLIVWVWGNRTKSPQVKLIYTVALIVWIL